MLIANLLSPTTSSNWQKSRQEWLDMIKSKESNVTDTKPQPIYRSYFAEFIDASKNHHTVIPTGADLRIVSLVTTDKALSRGSKDNTPVYSIKPTETGIAYRKDSEDDWQSERGIYFFGSMPRAVDTEIKNAIYPDSSKWHHDLRIAGKSNRAGLILRLPFSKALISLVQKNYTKHLVPGNIMLTIDHNAQIYHFGYIAVAEQAD